MDTARPRPVVLVVEDDDDIRRLAVIGLRQGGFDVVEARNACSAIVVVDDATRELAALVVDMGLPDRPGSDVVDRAMSLRPGVPIVVCSGTVTRGFAPSVLVRPKPYLPTQLLAVVRSAIDAAKRAD